MKALIKAIQFIRRVGFFITLFIPKVFITLGIVAFAMSASVVTKSTSILRFALVYTFAAIAGSFGVIIMYKIIVDSIPWPAIVGGVMSSFGIYVAMVVDMMLRTADSPEFRAVDRTPEGKYYKATMFFTVCGAFFGSFLQMIPSVL
jgi:hypothetical protein